MGHPPLWDSSTFLSPRYLSPCTPIKLIVLIMQQPETPFELAITSYTPQLHIPFEDQSSIRQIAEDLMFQEPPSQTA